MKKIFSSSLLMLRKRKEFIIFSQDFCDLNMLEVARVWGAVGVVRVGASCFSPPGDMSMKNSKTKSTGETSNESVLLSRVASPLMSVRFQNLSNTETVIYSLRTCCCWFEEGKYFHEKVISLCVWMAMWRRRGAW